VVSWGQITIDSSDLGQIGDQVIMVTDTAITGLTVLPASSSAQTFDYTGLSFSSTDSYNFLNPAGGVGSANFPNANVLIDRSGSQDLIYAIKSQNEIVIDGAYGDPFDIGTVGSINFDPNVLLLPFPTNYADNFSSSQIVDTVILDTVTGIFDSLRLRSTTSIVSNIDAFGTLNLPNTSADVLRKFDIEVRYDSVWGQIFGTWQSVQQTATTRYYYRFIAKNKSYYFLEVEADQTGNVLSVDYQIGVGLIAGISNQDNVTCHNGSNGSVEVLSLGGVSPYTYAWSNGQTGSMVNSLPAGALSVTVTDASSSTFLLSTVIMEPNSMQIVASQIGHDYGASDGYIDIIVSGGVPSFSYIWSNGKTTKNVSSLDFGSYSVTVTDANGCTNTNTFDVDDVTSVKDINESDLVSIYPNPTHGGMTIEANQEWRIVMMSITGGIVLEKSGFGTEILNLENLNTGFYILKIYTEGEIVQAKIQKL
jgi:hypothetical protein